MDETDEPPRRRFPRIGRAGRILVGLALVLLAIVLALWIERRPIASHFIDDTLAAKRVPARYTIQALGLGRQRLTGVVLGDLAHPDLTADWIETEVGLGLHGPTLVAARAGHVRLNARLADGRLSLGAIDRLLPPPSGKPFALPKLNVDVADARMRLATPAGPVELALSGAGRLDSGFAGRLAAIAPRLASGACAVAAARFDGRVSTSRDRPSFAGPLRTDRLDCGGATVAAVRADLDVTLGEALDRWRGRVRLATGAGAASPLAWRAAAGTIGFAGTPVATEGQLSLALADAHADRASAGRLTATGRFQAGRAIGFDGQLAASRAAVAPSLLAPVARLRGSAAGTPAGPLVDALAAAVVRAGERFDMQANVAAAPDRVTMRQLDLHAASGAVLRVAGDGAGWASGAGTRFAGRLSMQGGGLPTATAAVAQATPTAPITASATVEPYRAGAATLALAPIRLTATPAGDGRLVATVRLSGPLGDGRVEALMLPLDLRRRGGVLLANPGCVRAGFERLATGGLVLQPARLDLCPTGAALVRVERGSLTGGARLAATHLAGRLGATPVAIDADGARVTLADRHFGLEGLRTRLGQPDCVTRLDVTQLDGRVGRDGLAGRFAGAGGQIGNVPLLLSNAAGDWRLSGDALTLNGTLEVSDAATTPRFQPLAARDVRLTLKNGAIAAGGTLAEPTTGTKVADVRIAHDLRDGAGEAVLTVAGLTFTPGFQPDLLTRLTFGVVADVRGTVTGDARIAWNPGGVTSTGTFTTKAMDLAAAFGPVTGIATTVHFTDLLNLTTAPGQTATIASVNPGVAVTNGTVSYRLLPGSRVQVEGARWPFAGGALTLDPTLLDFSAPRERRLTFHIAGVAADRFLQQFDFKNLDATGTFDGVLPMIFDESGGRIENGRLTARSGGGGIAYVGDLTQKDLGFWGNLAFQSLKSLRYRNLDIRMNGPLAGEMITDVRFAGVSQGAGAKSNFLIRRLQKLPFVFNIRIKAPFRGLIDSAQSFYDPRRLIQRNLPTLLRQQNGRTAPIQPPASETVP